MHRRTDGHISWKDVAVLVARPESVWTVAQGIAFLLCSVGLAVSILVLSLAASVRGCCLAG